MTQATTPLLRKDGNYEVIQDSYGEKSFRGDYTGTNLIYRGFALAGSDEGLLVWQIAKLAYDGSNNLLSIKWPQVAGGTTASTGYDYSWTNRASLTYL